MHTPRRHSQNLEMLVEAAARFLADFRARCLTEGVAKLAHQLLCCSAIGLKLSLLDRVHHQAFPQKRQPPYTSPIDKPKPVFIKDRFQGSKRVVSDVTRIRVVIMFICQSGQYKDQIF